jgi:hypothetical protein
MRRNKVKRGSLVERHGPAGPPSPRWTASCARFILVVLKINGAIHDRIEATFSSILNRKRLSDNRLISDSRSPIRTGIQ